MLGVLFEKVSEAVSRRGFLKRLVQATGAIGLVLAGVEVAKGVVVKCCDLCNAASVSCSGCVCQWCWTCNFDTGDGCTYSCNECYSSSGTWCNNRTTASGCPRTSLGQTTGSDLNCSQTTCSSATKILAIPCTPNTGGGGGGICKPSGTCT
jgi:hypothetical protein